MERLLKVLGKEYGNINQAALLLGVFAFVSQILGLFRDRTFAHFIGPGPDLDAYYAAFRVPDFIFISIASLFSVTVLVPFIVSKMRGGVVTDETKEFINGIFSVFISSITVASILVYLFMPYLVNIVSPGFDALMQEKVVMLSRIMLLSPIFLGLSNLFGSITQLFKKFFIYSLSPIFYNLGIIFGATILYPRIGIQGVAFGVVIGAFAHFAIQALSSRMSGFRVKFISKPNITEVKKVLLSSLPRTLGLAFNSMALLILVSLASYLHSGSISIFNLSLTLQSVTLGIIGLSYAVAAFPVLTEAFAKGDMNLFKSQFKRAGRAIVFWSVPMTFIFIVLRAQIVRVVLGSPGFSWGSTRLVAASLAVFSISIVAQGMIALLARVYYAAGNTRRPLLVNFLSSISIVLFAIFLTKVFAVHEPFRNFIESLFRISDVEGTEMLMLPLAYSLGTILNFVLLWLSVKRDFLKNEDFISRTFWQSLVAGFALGVVAYFCLDSFARLLEINTFWSVLLQGAIAGVAGALAAFLVLYLFGNQEFKDIRKAVQSKFWKVKVLVPSQEEKL